MKIRNEAAVLKYAGRRTGEDSLHEVNLKFSQFFERSQTLRHKWIMHK